jgi:hypothetical protein
MKKKSTSEDVNQSESEDKSVFRQAGELIGSIGAHIVQGKDKVMDFMSDEVTIVKKAIKKKLAKKSLPKKKAKTKVTKKIVKKTARKLAPKKTAKKRPTKFVRKAKKAAKKSASNRMRK